MASVSSSQRKFLESEEAKLLTDILKAMEKDGAYNTDSSYMSNVIKYPDHNISFVDKHMLYLSEHPKLNPRHYISNLKLMTRVKVK